MSWTYTDTADQVIAVTECTTELVGVHIGINARDGRSVTICIPADKRRNAAQAVAGDRYRVVLISEYELTTDRPLEQAHEDLDRILDALGLDVTGRPYSAHECVTRDVLPAIQRLQQTASMPTWERELLAGQAAQEEIDGLRREVTKLREHRDELRQRITDNAHARLYGTAQPDPLDPLRHKLRDDHARYTYDDTCPKCRDRDAQPDTWAVEQATCVKCAWHSQNRPEPVDPASVRVGQVVEIEADDGSWMVRGECSEPPDNVGYLGLHIDSTRVVWISVIDGATVRVLHRAEPEPDEAAVEALKRALRAVDRSGLPSDDEWIERRAVELIRDHGVRVEVSE